MRLVARNINPSMCGFPIRGAGGCFMIAHARFLPALETAPCIVVVDLFFLSIADPRSLRQEPIVNWTTLIAFV
jgi:hypothetical protein